jgi:hypothetical protein
MTTSKKLLIAALTLNAVIQLLLGCWVLLGLDSLLNTEHMTYTADLKVFSTFFGLCLLIFSALGIMAIEFVRKSQDGALTISKFIGWSLLMGGVVVILEIKRVDLAAVDMARGLLILVFAYISERSTAKQIPVR